MFSPVCTGSCFQDNESSEQIGLLGEVKCAPKVMSTDKRVGWLCFGCFAGNGLLVGPVSDGSMHCRFLLFRCIHLQESHLRCTGLSEMGITCAHAFSGYLLPPPSRACFVTRVMCNHLPAQRDQRHDRLKEDNHGIARLAKFIVTFLHSLNTNILGLIWIQLSRPRNSTMRV